MTQRGMEYSWIQRQLNNEALQEELKKIALASGAQAVELSTQ